MPPIADQDDDGVVDSAPAEVLQPEELEDEPAPLDIDDAPASGQALMFELGRAFDNGARAVDVMTPPTSEDE